MKIIHTGQVSEIIAGIKGLLQDILKARPEGTIHLGVPGGRSVIFLIQALAGLDRTELSRLVLILVDERLEGEKNRDSLLDSGLQSLIDKGLFTESQLVDTRDYEGTPFDAVFLGVGEDGHVASLFPPVSYVPGPATMLIEDSPKPPPKRVTITYSGFLHTSPSALFVLLLFGEGKRKAFQKLLGVHSDSIPAGFFASRFSRCILMTDLRR